MSFTILGASGFLGSHLAAYLRGQSINCYTPGRNDPAIFERDLGEVIFSIGLTADFRTRPFDTVHSHVGCLLDVLERARFKSLLYLSSTRLYRALQSSDEESLFRVNPQNSSDLYNLSKLMGESLCFATDRPQVRVVRLSNLYGRERTSPSFLTSVIHAAVDKGHVELQTALESEKDYVNVEDVVRVLVQVALNGSQRLYNIASGVNVTNRELMEALQRHTGCSFSVIEGAPFLSFPPINIARIRAEFGFAPTMLLDSLAGLLAAPGVKRG